VISTGSVRFSVGLIVEILLGLLATGLVASSNYVINEVLDAPFDATHPTKALPAGAVGPGEHPAGLPAVDRDGRGGARAGVGDRHAAAATLLGLWVMGCVYNIPPVRSKDLPYIDVLTEAINNPSACWSAGSWSRRPHPAAGLVDGQLLG
jgi:hypothetical protein